MIYKQKFFFFLCLLVFKVVRILDISQAPWSHRSDRYIHACHTRTRYLVCGRRPWEYHCCYLYTHSVLHYAHIVAYSVSRQMTTQNTRRYNINNISCVYEPYYNHYIILPIIKPAISSLNIFCNRCSFFIFVPFKITFKIVFIISDYT